MNLPKFLLRRAPRAAAQPSEQLADPHDAGRSESPFSFVSRPSSSHSTQDLSPTSEHPSDEGDRAFNEAIVLLSRYRDAFHDIAQFQQLEDRLSKLSSLPPNPPPGKLIKGARKLQINELARTNSERYRAEATSLLRDVQATIGNLNATSSSASAAHGLIPSAVRSSTTPLSSGKTEFPLQQNGMEHHNSIRRYKSSDAQGRSGTSAPIVESSIPRPLPVVHEETSEGMSRDRHHDLSRSKYYEDRKYRKERDRAKDKERERERDKYRDRERDRERRKERPSEDPQESRRRSHSDTHWDRDYDHHYHKYRREPPGSLDEDRERYDDRDRERERRDRGERQKDRDRHRDKETDVYQEKYRNGESDRHRNRDRDRERDRHRDGHRDRDRERESERDRDRERRRERDRDRDRDRDRERQKERERDKDRERRRDRGEERHQERERIRVQAMDNAINEEPEDHRESEDLVGVQEEERRLEDGEPDMQTPTEQSEQIEYIDPPNEDDGNVKETEVETPDPGNKGHPEQPLALQYHRQDVKEREKARERRRERTKERDDLDGHRGHHDQHYYDDKYGWTSKGLPYDYHYTDKYQAHKRSHSHTGYPYGYYDRRRYEDYGIHAIRGQRSDDDRHRDRDRDRDKERYDRHHYRDKRDYEQERDRNGHDRREQQVFPQGNHESSHVRNRGSDEEPILMIPPPGWRAQQRQNQDHHRDGKERRPSPIKATQTQHTTTPISSPAPPTLLDYPTSVRSASMAVIVPTAAPAGRTAAGNPKPGGTSAGTHWNPEALRNREQAAQAQKLSNNEPQITEPPVVWNQASLVATAREQQKKQRFRRIPWFPTPAGSRLLEMFSPQVAKGRKQPLPPVGMKFDSHLD